MYKRNKSIPYNSEQQYIMEAIEETLRELECINNNFDNIKDPGLIETVIYKEDAAKAKYRYLINEARRLGMRYNRDVV